MGERTAGFHNHTDGGGDVVGIAFVRNATAAIAAMAMGILLFHDTVVVCNHSIYSILRCQWTNGIMKGRDGGATMIA